MPTPKLTPEIINAAIIGFESQKSRIDLQIAELRAMLDGGTNSSATTPEPTKRKRRILHPPFCRRESPVEKDPGRV